MTGLIRLGAICATIGGALRIATAFIPYRAESVWLEALYGVVDICLMLGLIAIYLTFSDRLARMGLAGFVIALIGIASIVGPDPVAFGINFYELGALTMLGGVSIMAIAMLRARVQPNVAMLWLGSSGLVAVGAVTATAAPIALSGITLGAGFMAVGRSLLTERPAGPT